MTTTQTQVTGPVDDAIDADVDRLIDCAQTWAMNVERGNTITACTDKDEAVRLAHSITRRLAPRADALIEREQVRKAVIAGAIEARGRSEDEQFSVITDAIMKISAITDSVMALLPRAPMPDVVTISRASARHGLDAMELLEREQPADEPQQFPTWYEAMREITAALEAKT